MAADTLITIVYIGWGVIVLTSAAVIWRLFAFYRNTGRMLVGRLVLFLALGILLSLYSLGGVVSMFLIMHPNEATHIMLPGLSLWLIAATMSTGIVYYLSKEVASIIISQRELKETMISKSRELQKANNALMVRTQELSRKADESNRALAQVAQFAARADHERSVYLLLLSSIGEGGIVVDIDEKITIMNKSAETILGFGMGEAVGQKFMTAVKFRAKEDGVLDYSYWGGVLTSKETRVLPKGVSIISRSGTAVPVMGVSAPNVDNVTREIKGLIITFRDVREERALEDARLGFISLASHQLRTPLTLIKWFSEMMAGGDAGVLNEQQKQFITYIYQGTLRMIDIVNLLLQIARVEAGRVKIAPIPLDMKKLVGDVVASLKAPLVDKAQHVSVTAVPDPLPLVPLDQSVVWQVVQNLLTNAIRYSPKEAEITVTIAEKKNYLELSVKDRGIGIPVAQQGRIFEKFFRADNALVAAPEGTGLGLSLVKQLVDGWGGRIWFETEEGKGTTFYVTIPLVGMKAREGDVVLNVGTEKGTV